MCKTSDTDSAPSLRENAMIISRQRKRAGFQQLPQLAATIGTFCASFFFLRT
jgi:hypothetical protein